MKRIILSFSLFFLVSLCFSQDSVYVEGFYIQRFLKREISFKAQQLILSQEGKSFQQMIDCHTQSFYFASKIDSVISLMDENGLYSMLYSSINYKNIEVFMFPPFNKHVNDLIRDIPITYESNVSKGGSYFTLENDTVNVYKIYRIQGHALRLIIDNDYLNMQRNINMEVNWNIDSSNINKKIPSFYAYFFFRYKMNECQYQPQGFRYWNALK